MLCCQSAMVAQATSLFPQEEDGGPPAWGPSEDYRSIATTFQHLEASGWYWGAASASEAQEALLGRSEGTFLVRDSSHPRHLLTLSVRTCCGPTSVRVEYSRGSFWLDSASATAAACAQTFPDVLSLVQHYVGSGQVPRGQAPAEALPKAGPEAAQGGEVPLKLTRPLRRPGAFPSLRHLTRLAINGRARCPARLPLPKPLLHYLQDYPFHI